MLSSNHVPAVRTRRVQTTLFAFVLALTCGCLRDVDVPKTEVPSISSPSGSVGKRVKPVEKPISQPEKTPDEASPVKDTPAAIDEKEAAPVKKAIPGETESALPSQIIEPAGVSLTRLEALIGAITLFVIACFVGYEVINKVPTTLHTPLMSGSNAISGIAVVGAIIIGGYSLGALSSFVGFLAIVLAMINVVGGFLVTHRMLAMFKRK